MEIDGNEATILGDVGTHGQANIAQDLNTRIPLQRDRGLTGIFNWLWHGDSRRTHRRQVESELEREKIRDEQWEREDTAMQRKVQDLRRAGISPNVFFGRGGGGSPSSASPRQKDDDNTNNILPLLLLAMSRVAGRR